MTPQHATAARPGPDLIARCRGTALYLTGPAAPRVALLLADEQGPTLAARGWWLLPADRAADLTAYAQAARLLLVGLPTPTDGSTPR